MLESGCCQWLFTLGGYFDITIYVCLNRHVCYYSGNDPMI